MKKVWIVILISILFSCENDQCENDQIDPIINNNPTGLLSKILISGTPYQEFTYTDAGLIYEEKSWGTYTKYSYNHENQLIKQEYYIDPSLYSSSTQVIAEAQKRKEWANPKNVPRSVTNTYTYPSNGQVIDRYIDRQNGTGDYTKYELNNKGQVSKEIFYFEEKLSGYIENEYDERGNLTKRIHYFVSGDGKALLSNQTEYEYDNQKNPYFPFKKLIYPGRNTNRNNIVREIYTLYGDLPKGIEPVQIHTHSYEYNELGYPVKVDGETSYEYY